MSVGILIITHGELGDALLGAVRDTLGLCPLQTETLKVPLQVKIDEADAIAARTCERIDSGEGVLILADLYGSTPSNIAMRAASQGHRAVITGVNLPMLIRIMNYPTLTLEALADKACSGAKEGIILSFGTS